jgi:hypothetical protein
MVLIEVIKFIVHKNWLLHMLCNLGTMKSFFSQEKDVFLQLRVH